MMKFSENIEKIFIAGVNGMVGQSIYRAYLKKENLDKKIVLLVPSKKELDLSDYYQVDEWFKKNRPDVVINAAAKVGGIYANKTYPAEFILDNLKIQTNVIEISKKYLVKKFLFLGSSCIYPKFAPQPIEEEALLTNSLEFTNEFYAVSKIAGIKLCQALHIQYKFNAISLMPSNLYGPGDNYNSLNSHVLPALIKKIYDAKNNNLNSVTCWGDGTPLREFLYVDDLADACLFVLDNWNLDSLNSPKDKNNNLLYWVNVGSEFEINIKDLANLISGILGYEGKILWDKSKPNGTLRKKLNTSRLRDLGWVAKTNLKDGIELTIKYYEDELRNRTLRK